MASAYRVTRTVATVALLPLLIGLVGCSGDGAPSAAPRTTAPRTTETGSATTSPSSPAPTPAPAPAAPPPRYRPDPAEVDGAAKRTAARAVEALPEIAQVTYTQYFGYLPPKASILVEADFVAGGGTTYAVGISQDGDRWRVDEVEPAAPLPATKSPDRLIRQVLRSKRIDLPRAGRVDVASGRVADSVLRSMLAVATRHRIGISVLISAHPVNVFGTDRRSNHPDGLAYDIGSIDGRLVVAPGAAALVHEVMRTAAGTGAYQVGGPDDLDGGGSQYFSDLTHSDHVHVGFSS